MIFEIYLLKFQSYLFKHLENFFLLGQQIYWSGT